MCTIADGVATDDGARHVDDDGECGAQRIEPKEGSFKWQSDGDLKKIEPRAWREKGDERNAREPRRDQHAGGVGEPDS